jgi:hypothetical protein
VETHLNQAQVRFKVWSLERNRSINYVEQMCVLLLLHTVALLMRLIYLIVARRWKISLKLSLLGGTPSSTM